MLLTEERLSGTRAVRRWLAAERNVQLVSADDVEDVASAIEEACNVWGGAYHPLVPIASGATAIVEPWATLVRYTMPTRTITRGHLPVPEHVWPRDPGGHWYTKGGGELPLLVLAVLDRGQGFKTIRSAGSIPLGHPWGVAYRGIVGALPATIVPDRLSYSGLRPGVAYSDLVTIQEVEPDETSADHLLALLRDPIVWTPVHLSCVKLALASAPTAGGFGRERPDFPMRFHEAGHIGPNVVVVYEPGSPVDLCVLWHLRAVHGLRAGLPLAVPTSADVGAVLRRWWNDMAMQPIGFGGTKAYLVSASVERSQLDAFAAAAGEQWKVCDIADVLQPSHGCGVESTEVVLFSNGQAQLAGLHPDERAALGNELVERVHHTFELVATPVSYDLPPSATLATAEAITSYRGGFVTQPGASRHSVSMHWPSGLTVLDAVLRDVGMRGEPSYPGRLAELLLTRTQKVGGLVGLLDPKALGLLDRLATRHGMTWFKRRLRDVVIGDAQVPEDVESRLLAIEQRVAALGGIPSTEEQHGVTFEAARSALGANREGAGAWLRWAEESGLVVRGAEFHCDQCTARSWLPVADLAPPVVCRGCGRVAERPYPQDGVAFRYQGSEFLLRLFKEDVIPHALTFQFVASLFEPHFDRPGPIFGAYPGVTIRRPGLNDPIGEADVLLVMADGRLGVAECKANAAGLDDDELTKLDLLARELNASWTLCATTDRSANCGLAWHRDIGSADRPHYVLTAEHLLDAAPYYAAGTDPFAWREQFQSHGGKALSDDERHQQYLTGLRNLAEWQRTRGVPWWRSQRE
jgi:hypothetical protein